MNKYLCIGPGGVKCNCCFPAPRSKGRRAQFRSAKRKEEREAFRLEYINGEDDNPSPEQMLKIGY